MSNSIDCIKFNLALNDGGQFLLDKENLVILFDTKLKTLYIKGNDLDSLRNSNIDIASYSTLVVDDINILNYIKDIYSEYFTLEFYTYAYLKKDKIDILKNDFRILDDSYYDLVRKYYEYASDEELKITFANRKIFGLFVDDKIVGFIGIHLEKTMGMLHVFKEYRGHNYGYILEANLINYLLDNDEIIYCDVVGDNFTSMHIQEKLGLIKADKKQYWLFKDE